MRNRIDIDRGRDENGNTIIRATRRKGSHGYETDWQQTGYQSAEKAGRELARKHATAGPGAPATVWAETDAEPGRVTYTALPELDPTSEAAAEIVAAGGFVTEGGAR